MKKYIVSAVIAVSIVTGLASQASAEKVVTAKTSETPKRTRQLDRMVFRQMVYSDISIQGNAVASLEQCIRYLRKQNPTPYLECTIRELVEIYYEEGAKEGIRPDLAFAQALWETGHFRYGGDVVPFQNNYCGLGTTGGGAKGAWFPTPRIGVRAQIQHLMAYATTEAPVNEIVDPRYELLRASDRFGKNKRWTDLNGKWAVPGNSYGQNILMIHARILES
ncbi:glucosaminidase domain-containing protein [Azotosporobacter soli]|uniref:glucosaminidase domain-containing protein n=1 Tax=Azotosporobacter soli TaxID=3055040 RepID=UPI0031FE9ECC